jgi:hypothetical protein
MCGFATGITTEAGSGRQFVQFVGSGILIPILGSVGAILNKTQEVTEKSTYADTQLIQKTTTATSYSESSLHPLAVMGSFFVAFALLALLKVVAGALIRKSGLIDLMRA